MTGFVKLFDSLTESTVWVGKPPHVKLAWITLLLRADQHGRVETPIPGLAKAAEITLAEFEDALALFMAPDQYSRTQDHEGRRVSRMADGALLLLNYARYRELRDDDARREQVRAAVRKHRESLANQSVISGNQDVITVSRGNQDVITVSRGKPKQKQKQKQILREISGDKPPDPHVSVSSDQPVESDPWGMTPPGVDPESPIWTSKDSKTNEQAAADVFAYWASTLWPRVHPDRKPKASVKRMAKIRARMADGYSVSDLKAVIDRVASSPYHLGENDSRTPYIEPETIMRNPEKVDQWLAKPVQRAAPVQRDLLYEQQMAEKGASVTR